jgi:O-antigen/teichoic acid export membrane protein
VQVLGKQGIVFLTFLLCARLLTPYDFGIYNYVLAIIFLLITFSDFGISTATSIFVAKYNAINSKKVENILFNSMLVLILIGVVISLLVISFGNVFFKDKYLYILIALPLIFFSPISSLLDGIFRGLRRFRELAIISLSVSLFSIGFVYLLVVELGLIGALISQILFYFLLVCFLFLRYKKITFVFDFMLIKKILSYSFLIGVAAIGGLLYAKIDTIILGQFEFIEEIGYYEIINKILQIIIMPIGILATVVAPNTIKKIALKQEKQIFVKFKKEIFLFFLSGVFISLLIYLSLPSLLHFLPKYNIEFFKSLLVVYLFLVPFKLYQVYLSVAYIVPCGFAKIPLYTLFIFGAANIFLSIVLLNEYGFIGVIYATVITSVAETLLKTIIFYTLYRKKFNLVFIKF